MKWANTVTKKWRIVAIGTATLVVAILGFVTPKIAHADPVQAYTGNWINRYYINVNGSNYLDNDTYDSNFTYVQQDSVSQCPNEVVFRRDDNTSEGNLTNVFFFYHKDWAKTYHPVIRICHLENSSAGQQFKAYAEQATTIANGDARRITFYQNTSDQIVSIPNGITFSHKGDYKGTPRYFRDDEVGDPNNSCPDMILLHAGNTMSSGISGAKGDTFFGTGNIAGSSILFAVTKDDSLSAKSESYDLDSEPNNIGPKTCESKSAAINQKKGGEYALASYNDTSADDIFFSSGLDKDGKTTANSDYSDDAFLIFIGDMKNVPKDATGAPITSTPTGAGGNNGDKIDQQSCKGGALGWIVCPIVSGIQKASDLIRDAMAYLLSVNPLPIGNGPIYDSWNNIRNLANIAFVFAFFAIIFSQATSIGISNYGIKRLLPRLIAIAVLTNISYFVCAVMIDFFNVLGVGVTSLLAIVNGGSFGTINVSDSAGLVVTSAIAAALVWAFATGAIVEIFPLIITVFMSYLFAFIVLVLRQAAIIFLVIFAPLAFVAGLLPGTQEWFRRWFESFFTLLLMYPLIMAMFAIIRIASAILTSTG